MEFSSPMLSDLLNKIKALSKRLGRKAVRPLLLLYYVLTDPNVPLKDKVYIYSSIAYIVLPINLLSFKRFHLLGIFDELASLAVIYDNVKKHVTIEMEMKADDTLDSWFGIQYSIVD